MKLTCKNISNVIRHSLPHAITEEQKKIILEGGDLPGFVRGEGVHSRFLFIQAKLEEKRADVVEMLKELPKPFRKTEGGGWSFLNACMTESGEQWGEHRNIDELICLGRALGLVEFPMPREMWNVLPGGMPYFSVNVA